MIKCIYGMKIGDSLIRNEDGSLQSIYPETFYRRNALGYWMIKKVDNWCVVLKVLFIE